MLRWALAWRGSRAAKDSGDGTLVDSFGSATHDIFEVGCPSIDLQLRRDHK
jgi:hypothetical protein